MDTSELLNQAWATLGGEPGVCDRVRWTGPPVTLPSRLLVTGVAAASVAAAGLAAAELAAARGAPLPEVAVDSRAVTAAFTSERQLRLDGRSFTNFAAESRFFPAADGWVRTHANYPHHRAALLSALGVPDGVDEVTVALGEAIAARPAAEVADTVTGNGGLAVEVRSAEGWRTHPQAVAVAPLPLVAIRGSDVARRRLPA
ncbi:MAG: hypothetical protein ABJB98_12090, partial [Actinomycetota bacterium]